MSLGKGNIGVSQKRQSGGPFIAGSANNGLSVDPNTGKIVFGNDFADASPGSAVLLNDRKIDFPDSTTVRYRMQIPNIQTQDETLDFGGAAGMGITFNGQNLNAPNETQRLPFQAYVSNTRTGGYSVGFQAGRNSQVAVKMSYVDSATQLGGLRGGNIQVLNNSGTAALSQLNFVTPTNGSFAWRINPSAANNTMQIFNSGNLRIGVGADIGQRLQVQAAAGTGPVRFEISTGASVFAIDSTGTMNIASPAARTGPSTVLVRNNAGAAVQGIAGANGTILPAFVSITVVDGIITAFT